MRFENREQIVFRLHYSMGCVGLEVPIVRLESAVVPCALIDINCSENEETSRTQEDENNTVQENLHIGKLTRCKNHAWESLRGHISSLL